jgi:hypothetical protein
MVSWTSSVHNGTGTWQGLVDNLWIEMLAAQRICKMFSHWVHTQEFMVIKWYRVTEAPHSTSFMRGIQKHGQFIIFFILQMVHKNKYTAICLVIPSFSTHFSLWSTSFMIPSTKNVSSCVWDQVYIASLTSCLQIDVHVMHFWVVWKYG